MTTFTNLIAALITVESGGNDLALGDRGRALGPLQIHRGVVLDVNRRTGSHYQWKDMTNRAVSCSVFISYIRIYKPDATQEQAARIWNGGPVGHRRTSTLAYWRRVQRNIK